MNLPKRTYREFRTYKTTFEKLRPLFYLLYRMNRVPKSFYLKYTSPDPLPAVLTAPAVAPAPVAVRAE
jgi:hypothetical protein